MKECGHQIKHHGKYGETIALSDYYSYDNLSQSLICLHQAHFYAVKQNKGKILEQRFPRGGCNDGIAVADKDNDIYLLNSDTILPLNAFFWLKIGSYENEKVGSTGSVTNYAANGQMIQKDWKSVDDIISFGNMTDILFL